MNPIDHFVKRRLRCKGYLRYVDDFLLFAEDKETLWSWREQLILKLAHLRLTIHPQAQVKPVTNGIPFLGFNIFPEKRRLKRRKGIHYQRKFKKLKQAYAQDQLPFDQVTASVQGWVNHVRYGNTIGLRKSLFSKPIHKKVLGKTS